MMSGLSTNSKMMSIPDIVERASFKFYSENNIKDISVKLISDSKAFSTSGQPTEDGLYSPALGPFKRGLCATCGQTDYLCAGHFGHIELSVPVYHPILLRTLNQILEKCCLTCHHFRLPLPALKLFLAQIDALNYGLEYLVDELDQIATDFVRDRPKFDEAVAILLEKKLNDKIEEERINTGVKDCVKPQLRSIVEKRIKLFRRFINNDLMKPLKDCEKCQTRKLTLRVVNQAAISFTTPKISSSKSSSTKKRLSSYTEHDIDLANHEIDYKELYVLQGDGKKYLTPLGAKHHINQIWINERKTMQKIFHFLKMEPQSDSKPVDTFFMSTIFVEPPRFRPTMTRQGQSCSHPRTSALSQIMEQSITIQALIKEIKELNDNDGPGEATRLRSKLANSWQRLQTFVNRLYDNEMDRYKDSKYPGLKQLIDKKQGLFRKNMMGKRVNFAARSVISPDPNIRVDEIGVPLVFAMKLTYPQPVTSWNKQSMRNAVLNGPNKYPGATSYQDFNGKVYRLNPDDLRQRTRLANSLCLLFDEDSVEIQNGPEVKVVHRHLVSGDVLLFNRQPTLHKPSIMAFKARVLPNEKGFRLHYANCKSFNADFDGDEMNAHCPQNEMARSEAYNLASVNYQYLVPKDGSPLGGLIQDHIVATCLLTKRDHFFNRDLYQQLVYAGLAFLNKPIKTVPPTIIRPQQLWTGKQVITTIILNCIPEDKEPLTVNSSSKIGAKIFRIPPKGVDMSDCNVIIRNGELLVGFIDKANIGATHYGLIHMCYELYGGETSSSLMSAFSRLATTYLQVYEGFTLGIKDILCEDDANSARHKTIKDSVIVGDGSAAEALGLEGRFDRETLLDKLQEAHSSRDPLPMKQLDNAMKSRTDKIATDISSRCLPEGLIKRFPDNNLQMMIHSGAKGGTVNALQISCLLGQIELEGRRVPLSMSGRTLPSFAPYDTTPKAGGFVSGRFLTGIRPQEFFFHCMAGREGLIDTAVKTSRSGYLQRCLIKHLEGLIVHYDQTVRDSCGSIIQFLYGEDGLDILKSQLIKPKAFPSLIDNYKIIAPTNEEITTLGKLREMFLDEFRARTQEIEEWEEVNGYNRVRKLRGSGFLDYLSKSISEFREQQMSSNADPSVIGSSFFDAVFNSWYQLSFKEKRKWNKYWCPCPDPINSALSSTRMIGSISEKMLNYLDDFFDKHGASLLIDSGSMILDKKPSMESCMIDGCFQPKVTKQEFIELVNSLFMKMSAQPGEAVGLIAAQSIGEPSTQMTLNTFHFAGRGEMNVTLGIPRLREILMTASPKIGTPSMDIPFLVNILDENGQQLTVESIDIKAQNARRTLNAVRLSDVLEYVNIIEYTRPIEVSRQTKDNKRAKVVQKCVFYKIEFNLLPSKFYKKEFKASSSKILEFIETKFAKQLVDIISKQWKKLANVNTLFEHSQKRQINATDRQKDPEAGENDDEEDELEEFNKKAEEKRNDADAEDDSSDEENDVEGGTDTTKVRSRRDQEQDYEDPEEDDLEVDGERNEEDEEQADDGDDSNEAPSKDPSGDVIKTEKPESTDQIDIDDQQDENETGNVELPDFVDLIDDRPAKISEHVKINRINNVKKLSRNIHNYDFDTRRERWCHLTLQFECSNIVSLDMESLFENEARKTFIYRVGNINRALLVKDIGSKNRGATYDKMIKTEGVSLLSLVRFGNILDLNAVYSNDIHAIANTYGIEAASLAIRREIANVFAVYGIEVDPRHLALIADYMTYNGTVRGMNRMSMEASASPLQQMTFESTANYLKSAALVGFHDDIKSPSAKLIFGRPTIGGTGLSAALAVSPLIR